MEIKAELKQPYSSTDRMDFIVKYNHGLSYEIRETEGALEAWGYTEEEKQAQERERINKLSMTKREMFLGLYQAKGITPDILKVQITDPQALIEFEYANDYYRGNPLIDEIGAKIGFTTEQLNRFFETKDYHYLTTCKLEINATPTESTVTGEGKYPYGTVAHYKVEYEGYLTQEGDIEMVKDEILEIELEKEE